MYLLLASIACSPREKKMPDVGLPLMQPRFLEFVIYLAVSLLFIIQAIDAVNRLI
jgi:hypothetical protein